mgnify:CR=1 FL=1
MEAGTWYTDAVAWAAANGIVNGVSDTQFAPGDDITREQLAVILYRYATYQGYDVSQRADLSGFVGCRHHQHLCPGGPVLGQRPGPGAGL